MSSAHHPHIVQQLCIKPTGLLVVVFVAFGSFREENCIGLTFFNAGFSTMSTLSLTFCSKGNPRNKIFLVS